jgi:thiamine-phosphate pyrophosphorylase
VRPRFDPTLYLLTDTELCRPRSVPDVVRAAVRGGVTAVQVRDKAATRRELYQLTKSVREALDETPHVALWVNDAVDVALLAGADGVHIGQDDLPARAVRRLIGPDLLLGLSVSSEGELGAATRLPAGTIDVVGIGPVWATPTKPDAAPPLDLAGTRRLAAAARAAGIAALAIGGIHQGNARNLAATGVDGICVVSAVCCAPDPADAARALSSAVRREACP